MNKTMEELAQDIVKNHVIENFSPIIEDELRENPELLEEGRNYEQILKEYNEGIENKEEWDLPEFYEFWSVDDWLAEKLENEGELIIDYKGYKVWGRMATGQAIYLDYVLEKIAEKIRN